MKTSTIIVAIFIEDKEIDGTFKSETGFKKWLSETNKERKQSNLANYVPLKAHEYELVYTQLYS